MGLRSPFLDHVLEFPVLDISAQGLLFRLEGHDTTLPPGTCLRHLSIRGLVDEPLAAQGTVLFVRQESVEGRVEQRCGASLTWPRERDRVLAADAIVQLQSPRVSSGQGLSFDDLWSFFKRVGFVYPEKEESLREVFSEVRDNVSRLLQDPVPTILRTVVYRDEGQVYGHQSLLRSYEHTWIVQHLSADPSGRRSLFAARDANIGVTDLMVQSPDVQWIKTYFQPHKSFPDRVVGGALARRVCEGRDFHDLPNLAYPRDGDLVFTRCVPEHNDLALDLLAWQALPEDRLATVLPVRGSRGCPHRCAFCNFGPGQKLVLKEPAVLGEEVAALAATGRVRILRFADDNAFPSGRHLEASCRQIIDRAPGLRWTSFIRASSITADNVGLLREAGCIRAQIGIESGDQGMLDRMSKRATPEQYLRAVGLLNAAGISTALYVFVGFPGETERTVDSTVELLSALPHDGPAVNQLIVFPFLLFPLSPIYAPENARKYGLRGYMRQWSHETMDSDEALVRARQVYDRVGNVYPNYGIEECFLMEPPRLKRMYQLRTRIREGERGGVSPESLEGLWAELRQLVEGSSLHD